MKSFKLTTTSSAQTKALAKSLALAIKPGTVIALTGELGGGKTTFTQGFIKALGITKPVLSPTFVLMRQYKKKDLHVYHLDLYRLTSTAEIKDLGISDMLRDKQGITIIEWAERAKGLLPKELIKINFKTTGPEAREITIIGLSQQQLKQVKI